MAMESCAILPDINHWQGKEIKPSDVPRCFSPSVSGAVLPSSFLTDRCGRWCPGGGGDFARRTLRSRFPTHFQQGFPQSVGKTGEQPCSVQFSQINQRTGIGHNGFEMRSGALLFLMTIFSLPLSCKPTHALFYPQQ